MIVLSYRGKGDCNRGLVKITKGLKFAEPNFIS